MTFGYYHFRSAAVACAQFVVASFLPLIPLSIHAQDQPPQAAPVTGAPGPTQPAKQTGPDYPDPRTFTIGLFYWATGPGVNPGILTGRKAIDYGTFEDLGKAHRTPGAEVSLPISRTGSLHAEYFLTKGDANQNSPAATLLFGVPFNQGDAVATQFQLQNVKFYLDDLLFPHKFPVARFRLKSLWGVEFVKIKSTIDGPYSAAGQTATGSQQMVLPSFGLAAEYAVSPHLLFRVDGSGFGLHHRSDLWDGNATIAYRHNQWEIVGGGKAFHFKTSPNTAQYFRATLAGGFIGLRWHF